MGISAGASSASRLKRKAVAVPTAISVNMLKRSVRSDLQPRAKNGAPPHSITGRQRISSAHGTHAAWKKWPRPGSISPIASTRIGSAKTRLPTKRRCMSTSSGLGPVAGAMGSSGSSAMPQLGHGTGLDSRTSGHMGQIHTVPSAFFAGAGGGTAFTGMNFTGSATKRARQASEQKNHIRPAWAWKAAGARLSTAMPHTRSTPANCASGSATNFVWHFGPQNQTVRPSCTSLPPFAAPGVTVMLQIGSTACPPQPKGGGRGSVRESMAL